MAEPNNAALPPEFEGLELDLPDARDPTQNSYSNQNGLSDFQRFVVKNFFDTQPKRRAAYMKRLGYELSKNGEEYRPVGSDGNYQPIEPDNTLYGFIPYYKIMTEEGRKELARDLSDISFDVASGIATGPAAAKGAAIGGASGTAVGALSGPVGAAVGGGLGAVSGAAAGGAAGQAAAETLKTAIGDAFLDEEVPIDMQEALYQSLTAGALSGFGKLGGGAINKWRRIKLRDAKEAIKEAAVRRAGGSWNDNLAEDLFKNPDRYTPEAVKGSTKELLKMSQDLFGTSAARPKSTRQLTGGLVRDRIQPLNEMADLEIAKLSKNAEANFSVDEIVNTLKKRISPLENKKFRTREEDSALKFFREEVEGLKDKMRVNTPSDEVFDPSTGLKTSGSPAREEFRELTFQEGRDFLKRLQNAAFEEGPVKGNAAIKSLANGLKEQADEKAGRLGSQLPELNAKRSQFMQTYRNLFDIVNDRAMQAAFIGKDSLAKQRVLEAFEEADRVLGTNLAANAQTKQFQAAVENLYSSPSAFGSGSVMGEGVEGGLKQAPKEAFRWATLMSVLPGVGPVAGAKIGAVKGFAQGFKEEATFASPKNLMRNVSKIKHRLDELDAGPSTLSSMRSPTSHAAQQVSPLSPENQEFIRQGPPPKQIEETTAPTQAPEVPELPPEFQDLELEMP